MVETGVAHEMSLRLPALFAGRYRIGEVIGRGGLAQVVRAVDTRAGREVALKFLYPSLHANLALVERFRREVTLVRRIEHPHVLRIEELVESDGQLALVMELRRGGDLATRLARGGPLPAATVLQILRQVCGALGAAHRAGIVHRDVKPQNILIGPDREPDCRVCDFGLARTTDAAGLTTHSMVLGTPEYMAPEVIQHGYADLRSDLYALGAVAFQALTGRVPFDGDSPYAIFHQHLNAAPPPVSALVPDVPPALEAAIERALEKDPLSRFGSADEMLAAAEGRAPARTELGGPLATTAFDPAPCASCGGRVYATAGVCADCGAARLRLTRGRPGLAVIVRGPGSPGHKLEMRENLALVKLLAELPVGACDTTDLATRPPRLPFYVARGLDAPSADELVRRLAAIGLAATIEKRVPIIGDAAMRKRARGTARGFFALSGMITPILIFFTHGHPEFTICAQLGGFVLGPLIAAGFARRALIRGGRGAPHDGDAPARLGRVLRAPIRREERRLVARVLDRLTAIERAGGSEAAAPLATRAALAAEGLARIADLNQAEVDAGGARGADQEAGLARLREAERVRAALLADLLRTAERVERMSLQLARIGTLPAAADVAGVGAEIEALRAEVAGDREIEELLR